MKKIKFSLPNILNQDKKLVNDIINSGWLTHGKYTDLFESEIKKYTNAKYAITLSSCTAALHLSCLAAGFKKGDEVIVPAQTHTATAHAVEYTGAKAVLSDVDKLTGNINLDEIKKKISNKTKGIIVVHMAGYPCEMIQIQKYCKKNKLILIEDCAHSLGTFVGKKHVGKFGISGCFSFYPTKQITTGEGGALITDSKEIFQKIKKLKAFGIDKDIKERKKPGDYDVKMLGFNYRMTDFQAALGYSQIVRYKYNLNKRHLIVKRYIHNLKRCNDLSHMSYSKNCSFFVFQIFSDLRDELVKFLNKEGIGISIHYLNPLNKMSFYKKKYNLRDYNFKNSNNYSDKVISLPVYPKLKLREVDIICKKIMNFYN
jgi:perosamine synthetase